MEVLKAHMTDIFLNGFKSDRMVKRVNSNNSYDCLPSVITFQCQAEDTQESCMTCSALVKFMESLMQEIQMDISLTGCI